MNFDEIDKNCSGGNTYFITRNRGHFEPVNNRQRYITLRLRMSRSSRSWSRSNMAAAAARSEKKRVCYEMLHILSTADICMLFVIPQDIRQFNERESERNYLLICI